MRDLLRYILISVLVVVVGWFLIGELKEWTIVDNSVTVESDGGWELLYELNDYVLGKNDYIMFDIDYQGYDIVAFQVSNFSYIGIVNRNYFHNDSTAPGLWGNFSNIIINFLDDSFILENNSSSNQNLNVKIWGVK